MFFMVCHFFFFKQKTAYEMRISDWSSDVCSSDLAPRQKSPFGGQQTGVSLCSVGASFCRRAAPRQKSPFGGQQTGVSLCSVGASFCRWVAPRQKSPLEIGRAHV